MKKEMLMVTATLFSMSAAAQTATDSVAPVASDSVALQEVEVKASRMVPRTDGMTIFPSQVQLLHSTSGYSLIGKLTGIASKLVNAQLHKQVISRSNSDGNLVMLGVSWNINRGKEYRKIEKSIQNKERETGILK